MQGTQAALDVFDGLAPVPLRDVRGAWRGKTFPSGHPLDGVLEACGWHGKRFDDEEHVHPLVFRTVAGGLVHLRPWGARLALLRGISALRSPALGRLAQLVLPLLATRRSQARLRCIEYRGKSGAAIVYDQAPILDVLRRIDEHRVLGLMDMKGQARPFFFVLERER